MKKFKDLEFETHHLGRGRQAKINFDDGSEISVICGSTFFYCGPNTYEMMSNRTRINGGVRGWLSEKKITEHLIYVQRNPLK